MPYQDCEKHKTVDSSLFIPSCLTASRAKPIVVSSFPRRQSPPAMTTQEASAHAHHPHPHPTSRPALKKRPTSSGRLSRLAALTTSKVNTPSKTHRHTRSKSSTCDSESEREPEENDHMAASFLQYW